MLCYVPLKKRRPEASSNNPCINTTYGKCKEKLVILQSTGIIAIKSSETRAVIYTCKITKFSLHLFVTFFGNSYNIGVNSQVPLQKKE